jgi:hypothetical protein
MANADKINKNNFEKYLKDFEDGSLNNKLSEELLCFIETYHLLEQDNQSEIVLHADEKDGLNAEVKQMFLQLNTENEAITEANIHYFLKSKVEGLLDHNAHERLEIFLNKHQNYRVELMLLEQIKLTPDKHIKFHHKAKLKQKQTRLLWPIIATAACFAGLIIFSLNFNHESIKASAVKHFVKTQKDSVNSNQHKSETRASLPQMNLTQTKSNRLFQDRKKSQHKDSLFLMFPIEQFIDTFDTQEENKPESIPLYENLPEEVFFSWNVIPDLPVKPSFKSQTLSMNNPIHPITSGLSYLTQQEIDFRMANNALEKKGRYFLKIGKLEILHVEN